MVRRRPLSRTTDRLTRRPARLLVQAVENLPPRRWRGAQVRSAEVDAPLFAALVRHRSFDVRAECGGCSYSWKYDVTELGLKGAMNDIAAAIGLGQLPYVEEDNERRREIGRRYREGIAGTAGIELLREHSDRVLKRPPLLRARRRARPARRVALRRAGSTSASTSSRATRTRCSPASRCRAGGVVARDPCRCRFISPVDGRRRRSRDRED